MVVEVKKRSASSSLDLLVNRIRSSAGFELYSYDAYPNFAYTDLPTGLNGEDVPSTRKASYNLKNTSSQQMISTGCFYGLGGVPCAKKDNTQGLVSAGVVSKLEWQTFEVDRGFREVSVPRKGMFGKMGFEKKEIVPKIGKESRYVKVGNYALNDIINTDSNSPACCLITNVLAGIPDHTGRLNGQPNLIVYCDSALRGDIYSFLKDNPQMYAEYHRALLPAEQFPKIREKVISNMSTPTSMAYLICSTELENAPRDTNGYLREDILNKHALMRIKK